jgi:T5SS/PEP-CTERM-associated repeat protein
VTTYQFFGEDMNVATNYQPNTGSLPTAGDTVTTVANAPTGFLDNASLTIGTFNNTELIDVFDSAALTVTTYNDTGETAISGKGTLTVNGNYTANSVHISDAGSQLVVNGTLTVSNGGTIGSQGLYVSNGASETWSNVVLAGSAASPLLVDTSASIEVSSSLTFVGGDLTVTNGGTATIDTDVSLSSGSIIVGLLQTTGPAAATATFKGNLALNGGNAGAAVFAHGTLNVQGNVTVDNGAGGSASGGTIAVHGSAGMSIGINGTGVFSVKLGGHLTVDQDTNIGAQAGVVGNRLTLADSGSTLTVNNIIVGDAASGLLSVSDGASATVNGNLTAGNQQGSTGNVQVSGNGVTAAGVPTPAMAVSGNIVLGNAGNVGSGGNSYIKGGGFIELGGSLTLGALSTGFGSLIIKDPGSGLDRTVGLGSPPQSKVVIGDAGFGSLLVENHARLFPIFGQTEDVTIANQQGSLGTLTVTGGATADVHSLAVGVAGNGFLHVDQNGELTLHDLAVDGPAGQFSIQSGGTVTGSDVKFGNTSRSHATVQVDGTGSSLFYDKLEVGTASDAVATLSVTAGGAVKFASPSDTSVDDLDIGTNGGSGSVSVDGTDSTLKAETATVGRLGSITASNGGTVDLAGSINIGSDVVAALRADTGAILVGGTNQNGAPGIYVGAFNSIRGYGLIRAATLSDYGFVIADGGILQIGAPVTGPADEFDGGGILQISANSTLELLNSCQVGATFLANGGFLELDAPASFQGLNGTIGQIGGFQASDTIELFGVTLIQPTTNPPFVGTHTTVNGHTTWTDPDLVVKDINGVSYEYELLGNYTDPVVSVSVTNGDSFITLSSGTYREAVESVSTQPSSGNVSAGQTVAISVVLSGAATVAGGTPTLALNDGGTAFYDAAHSTTISLVFDYTVGANDRASNLAITAVNLNGATVQDPNGAPPDFAGALKSLGLSVNNATPPGPNPPPPAGTTAVMIMNNPNNGAYEIYDVGSNAILAAYQLGQVGAPWGFAALGTFQAGDIGDMLLRNASTGAFEAYYVGGNNITSAALVGTVGLDWNFAGIGNFDGASSLSELMLRNASSGSFELYQVGGGGVLSGSSVAPVGNNFQVKGFGFFAENGLTQMLMQDNTNDASAGQLELYTYQPSTASLAGINVGKVGSNLSIVGCADLLGNGETQMVMQQNNGNFWLYTYSASTNSLSGQLVGAIGSNFHVVGFGPLGTAGQDEMLMQDAAGNFEVYQYNASLNAFVGNSMGAVGAPWALDGIAADSPSTAGISTAQLVQAIAGFAGGSGASESLSTAPLSADTSQQPLLTTPQHA